MPEEVSIDTLVGVLDKRMTRQLKAYLDVCARCAICAEACHQYAATRDVRYLPAHRAELVRRIYKKHVDRAGRLSPALYEGRDPDSVLLDELAHVTYACTGCRRCMYYCPFSIDTQFVLSAAKAILIAAGRGEEMLGQLADAAVFKGENAEMFHDVVVDGFRDIEQQLRELTGDPTTTIPVDRQGADVLYVALAGAHSILPAAAIFHQAGESWTLSLFESANYGFFLGDAEKARKIADRFMDEARRLGVKEVVITECGHAYRVASVFYEAWAEEKPPFKITHVLEKIDEYLHDGRLDLPRRLPGVFTYHDPCQIGRNGGIYEEPRRIVRALAGEFREMTPNRAEQWCCGGGGGIVAIDSMNEMRLRSGLKKVEQIRATGAEVVATPCENCRLQLDGLNERHGLGVRIAAVMDLVVEAMDLPGAQGVVAPEPVGSETLGTPAADGAEAG